MKNELFDQFKAEMNGLKHELKADIRRVTSDTDKLKNEIKADIKRVMEETDGINNEMRADAGRHEKEVKTHSRQIMSHIDGIKTDMKTDIGAVKTALGRLETIILNNLKDHKANVDEGNEQENKKRDQGGQKSALAEISGI